MYGCDWINCNREFTVVNTSKGPDPQELLASIDDTYLLVGSEGNNKNNLPTRTDRGFINDYIDFYV